MVMNEEREHLILCIEKTQNTHGIFWIFVQYVGSREKKEKREREKRRETKKNSNAQQVLKHKFISYTKSNNQSIKQTNKKKTNQPTNMTASTTLKPGQKHPTPTRGFGDRVFYETLLRQKPDSQMAQEWCVAHGVLPLDEAQKLYKIILKRKGKVLSTSSAKSDSSSKKNVSKKVKKEKKVIKEEADDVGMNAGGDEGIGGVTL
jgi:hypothetical protein